MREKLLGIHKFVGKIFLCDRMDNAKRIYASYDNSNDYPGICRARALLMDIRDASFLIKAGVFAADIFGIAFISSRLAL